jgi:NADH:ubiquinone oxidoreductase subunit
VSTTVLNDTTHRTILGGPHVFRALDQRVALPLSCNGRYGYRDAEYMLRAGLEERQGGGGQPPTVPPEADIDKRARRDGWVKVMDGKRRVHLFYNTFTGESSWVPPRWSKFFGTFVEENRKRVRMDERKVKVDKLVFADDPVVKKRLQREHAKRLKELQTKRREEAEAKAEKQGGGVLTDPPKTASSAGAAPSTAGSVAGGLGGTAAAEPLVAPGSPSMSTVSELTQKPSMTLAL